MLQQNKILIFGAKGQLGSELCHVIDVGRADVGAIDECFKGAELVGIDFDKCDITNKNQVENVFKKTQPNYVFNCAAYSNVDGCEENKEQAFKVNAQAVEFIAEGAQHHNAKLIHISTDYVFSGNEEIPRVEEDKEDPLSIYGKSKLEGELNAFKKCARTHVIRTAWLFGRYGKNFVETILNLADTKSSINVVDDQFGNPTSANDLAFEMLKIAKSDDFGIWHASGNGICSWAEFAKEIVRLSGKACDVKGISSQEYQRMNPKSAIRPHFSCLQNKKLQDIIGDDMRDWRDSLKSYMHNRFERSGA